MLSALNCFSNDTVPRRKKLLINFAGGVSLNQLQFTSLREYDYFDHGYESHGFGKYKGVITAPGSSISFGTCFLFSRYLLIDMDWAFSQLSFQTPLRQYNSYDEVYTYSNVNSSSYPPTPTGYIHYNDRTTYFRNKVTLNFNAFSLGFGSAFQKRSIGFISSINVGIYKPKRSFIADVDSIGNTTLTTALYGDNPLSTKQPNPYFLKIKTGFTYNIWKFLNLNLLFEYSRMGPNGGSSYKKGIEYNYEFTNFNLFAAKGGVTIKL